MDLREPRLRRFKTVGALVCLGALGMTPRVSAGREGVPIKRVAPEKSAKATKRLVEQPAADFASRRRDLMERIKTVAGEGEAIVVLRGEGPAGDSKYKQSNEFVYLTGVETPGAALILQPEEGRETLYLPPREGSSIGFRAEVGDAFGPGGEAAEALGFSRVESTSAFLGDLFRALADPIVRRDSRRPKRRIVYLLEPEGRPSLRFGQGEPRESRDAKFARFLREGAPTTVYKDLKPILAELRKRKSEGEIALLRKAIAITAEAQAEVIRTVRPGRFEYELEGKVLGAFIAGGAERAGFDSIIGSGMNGTFPHYFANRSKMEEGDLVVVDIGAEYRYYTADITRTYPVNGKFSPRQREIYRLVLDCQAECAAKVKPGETTMSDLNRFAREFLRRSPLRAKNEEGTEKRMNEFFIHGLGHYLGMEVHDVGDYGKPFQPGEVITIEPGLYIPAESIGVRIEDDYLVTPDGLEKLSKAIASDPDEIEGAIARARSRASGN